MKQNEPHDPNGSGDPPAVDKERIYGDDGVDLTRIRWMLSLTPTETIADAATKCRFLVESVQ